jgi:hemerythrin-like metal-binding protein
MQEKLLLERFKIYELGFPRMDLDHLNILRSIDHLRRLMPKGDIEPLDKAFTEFIAEADAHFNFEESIMRAYSYPYLDWHKEVHHGIRTRLTQVSYELKENKNKNRFLLEIKLTDVLEKHFISHIDDLDRQMVKFLIDKNLLTKASEG